MKVVQCRSCGADIIWAVTGGGKRMPVDAAPVKGFTLVVQPDGVVTARATPTHVSHFASCPEADEWRRQ